MVYGAIGLVVVKAFVVVFEAIGLILMIGLLIFVAFVVMRPFFARPGCYCPWFALFVV
jgi:hypothetical protein